MAIIRGMMHQGAFLQPNSLSLNNFRGDLFDGLTAAVVALPLTPAFGVTSGPGPVADRPELAWAEVIQRAVSEHKHVIIVGMTFPVARMLGRLGILNRVRESELFKSRGEAVRGAISFLADSEAAA